MKTHPFHFSRKKVTIFAVTLVVLAGVCFAVSKSAAAAKEKLMPKVQVTELEKGSLQDSVSVTGTIASSTSKNVYTTLNYPVKEIDVKVGDTVKAGQTLAVLDTDALSKDVQSAQYSTQYAAESARLNLQKAKSDYENALSLYNNNQNMDLVNAQSAVASAQQSLDAEKSNYNSSKSQYNGGKITRQALDQEQSKLDSAQSAYDKAVTARNAAQNQAQQNLKNLKNAYDAAQAKMNDKSQEITLEKQQQNLKNGVITAPVNGTVTASNAVVGAVPNGVLFTVEDTDNLIVKTEIKEYDVDKVTPGKNVVIKTDATGDREIQGTVTKIAPAATVSGAQNAAAAQDSSTVTFSAEIQIKDKNPQIKIGMKAHMNIIISQKSDIYTVPYDAVQHRSDGSAYVFAAVKEGTVYKAKEIQVQTGLENDISIEVSGTQLQDGIQIVNNPDNISVGSVLKL